MICGVLETLFGNREGQQKEKLPTRHKFQGSQTLQFQAITKHYGWYLGYRRDGPGKMVWQSKGQAAKPQPVLR